MAQVGLQNLNWVQGWGVVRGADEKLEFVAFFDTQEDAEAAAEMRTGCRVCWLFYKDGLDFQSNKN